LIIDAHAMRAAILFSPIFIAATRDDDASASDFAACLISFSSSLY